MYQLKADGPPSIPAAAFSWDDGRQTWLHPMISYEFDVMMNEPNGASDLSVVEVQLHHSKTVTGYRYRGIS